MMSMRLYIVRKLRDGDEKNCFELEDKVKVSQTASPRPQPLALQTFHLSTPLTCEQRTHFYLRRSRQVIEWWELLLLGGGLLWGHDLKVDLKPRSTFFWLRSPSFFSLCLFSNPKFPLGWDPSRSMRISQPWSSLTLNFLRGGISGSLTRFLFGVGSVT